MNNLKSVLLVVLFQLLISSCSDNNSAESTDPEIPNSPVSPSPVNVSTLYYSGDRGKTFEGEFHTVRIGEYLWMDNNFNTPEESSSPKPTKELINKCLSYYRIDGEQYNISMSDFTKYYGQYYSRERVNDMNKFGRMYVDSKSGRTYDESWQLPTINDFRQLYASCIEGKLDAETEIRLALACRAGDNPVAKWIPNTYWYQDHNTNKFKFNMLAGGARLNGDGQWSTIDHTTNQVIVVDGKKGDFHSFYEVVYFAASNGYAAMHDYPDIGYEVSYHWMNVRWCKRLTNEELGYKLYINDNKTDIRKLKLSETAPAGYKELENGYLRGFYVNLIMDRQQPLKTIAEIVNMSKNMPEYTRSNNIVK